MCQTFWNHIKTQLLVILEDQVRQTCWFILYSVGANFWLIDRTSIYIWLFTVHLWCLNLFLILPIKHNEEGNEIHKELSKIIPHFIKNCLHVKYLQDDFVMYNYKVIVLKLGLIPNINGSTIPIDCFQNNRYVINFIYNDMIFKFEAFTKNKIDTLYLTEIIIA